MWENIYHTKFLYKLARNGENPINYIELRNSLSQEIGIASACLWVKSNFEDMIMKSSKFLGIWINSENKRSNSLYRRFIITKFIISRLKSGLIWEFFKSVRKIELQVNSQECHKISLTTDSILIGEYIINSDIMCNTHILQWIKRECVRKSELHMI